MGFADFMREQAEAETDKNNFAINIDTKVTARQLIINRLIELDSEIKIDIQYSPATIWVKTKLSKSEIDSLVGVNYVVISDLKKK